MLARDEASLHLPYVSPTSPRHLPYISPRPPETRRAARRAPARPIYSRRGARVRARVRVSVRVRARLGFGLGSAPALHSAALHRLQRAPDLEVEIPEEPPPGTPAAGYAKLTFRKVVRGVPASMELNVARAMLPAMRFIASERSGLGLELGLGLG